MLSTCSAIKLHLKSYLLFYFTCGLTINLFYLGGFIQSLTIYLLFIYLIVCVVYVCVYRRDFCLHVYLHMSAEENIGSPGTGIIQGLAIELRSSGRVATGLNSKAKAVSPATCPVYFFFLKTGFCV